MSVLLHELLQQSAARRPHHSAIACGDDRVSYRELDRQSSQLASLLMQHGVGSGDRVGIYMQKRPQLFIALFAALKCGAAYVPIAASAPPQRARWQVEDADLKAVVTTSDRWAAIATPTLPALAVVVLVDTAAATVDAGTTAVLPLPSTATPTTEIAPPDLSAESIAYILYTSGSTGTPKGVMISHRAALNFVEWAVGCFGLSADDHVANHAPLQFDLSVFDIFATVMVGATLFPVPRSALLFPISLTRWLIANKISVWYSVPSALVKLVLYGRLDQYSLPDLRLILFAGEVFPVKYLRELMQLVPHPGYFNLYGPTETNVVTYYEVMQPPSEPLPIGQACANHTLHIVGADGEPVTSDEQGELLVSGPSLMSGYWRDKQRTDHSFTTIGGIRAYRTGDWVCAGESGDLRFIGRQDHMIKSRGYRIEPAEIEQVLYRHALVTEAAVIAVPDEHSGSHVWAIVATDAEHDVIAELADLCRAHLPAYMLPGRYVQQRLLPKTATGKIDRNAIRAAVAIAQ